MPCSSMPRQCFNLFESFQYLVAVTAGFAMQMNHIMKGKKPNVDETTLEHHLENLIARDKNRTDRDLTQDHVVCKIKSLVPALQRSSVLAPNVSFAQHVSNIHQFTCNDERRKTSVSTGPPEEVSSQIEGDALEDLCKNHRAENELLRAKRMRQQIFFGMFKKL